MGGKVEIKIKLGTSCSNTMKITNSSIILTKDISIKKVTIYNLWDRMAKKNTCGYPN